MLLVPLMLSITNLDTSSSTELESGSIIMIQGGSWKDYWSLSHEDLKVEFIDEVLYIHSPASLEHERIFRKVMVQLSNFLETDPQANGEVLGSRFPIRLKDGKRVEPDLVYLSEEDIEQGNLSNTLFEGSPSLIVEIVSPRYRIHDTKTKLQKYIELGVEEYWIIDPELKEVRQILITDHSISKNILLTEGDLIPMKSILSGFSISIDNLWS